jgi:hypothetical protein
MKFKIIILSVLALTFFNCNNSGGAYLGEGENNGKSFSIGDAAATKTVLAIAEAYSNQDAKQLSTYYDTAFLGEDGEAGTDAWLTSMNSITMKPYKIVPLSMNGSEGQQVLAWSKEERDYKNGSFERLDLMELFFLNKEGKVAGFKQWKAIDSTNFGRSYGGKFFGKKPGEYTGRPFQFSNRNETEMLETMVGHYNKMDIKAVSSYFADQVTINGYDGKQMKLSNKQLAGLFDNYKSVTWTPYSIVPIKIANTDAASGVMMFSNERRVLKSGRIWEKELMETFYFDLDGKISSVTQFAR